MPIRIDTVADEILLLPGEPRRLTDTGGTGVPRLGVGRSILLILRCFATYGAGSLSTALNY